MTTVQATYEDVHTDLVYRDALDRPRRRLAPIKRLRAKIRVTESGCHEFIGARNDVQYGQIYVLGRLMYTHRVMWIATHGAIPEGLCVLHRCDNPPCCNVEHLFLGTKQDNSHDARAKGRMRGQFKPGHRVRGTRRSA